MTAWRFVELRDLEPYRFQCMREALAFSVGEGFSPNALLFTQLAGEHISMGRNTSRNKMVHLDFCRGNGIQITRSFSPANKPLFIDQNTIRCLVVANRDTFDMNVAEQLFYEATIVSLENLGLEGKRIPKTNNVVVKERKTQSCFPGV